MREHTATNRTKSWSKALVAAVLAVGLMVPTTAFADPTSTEKQAEAQAALVSLDAMQSNLTKASDDYYTAQQEQADAEAKVTEAQARIDETNGEIAALQEKLGTRASSMYRNGSMSFLDILMGSVSFEDFATNWDLLNIMNQKDADLVQQSKDLRAEVEAQQQELTTQQARAAEKAAEAKKIMEEAQATTDAMQATYDSLSSEAAALLEQERAARVAVEAANAQSVVDAAIENANQNNGGGGGGSNDGGSGGGSGFVPKYDPVTGNAVVDRAYGCLNAPYGYAGAGPDYFDCSGLVGYCLTGSYSRIGNTTTFLGWQRVSDPQPGDIAVNSGHCGIYIGGGQMIHAATYGVGVIIGPVQSGMVFVRY